MSKIKATQSDVIATKKASEFGVGEPKFLWHPFLPAKKLVVCQGESGIGKSSFILNIASRLSRGEHMPFVESDEPAEIGNTLYFTTEDDKEETVNPRLIAMGADRDRIDLQTEVFHLDNDCRVLENTIRKLKSRLVIFDPLTSFLSSKHNMNTAQSVGNLVRELSCTAFNTDSTIVLICHLLYENSYNKCYTLKCS